MAVRELQTHRFQLSGASSIIKRIALDPARIKAQVQTSSATYSYFKTVNPHTRGIDLKVFKKISENFSLANSGAEQAFRESILFGGYEARFRATTELKGIAESHVREDMPVWKMEILKDLFTGRIKVEDWNILNTVTEIGQGENILLFWTAGTETLSEKISLIAQLRTVEEYYGLANYESAIREMLDIHNGTKPAFKVTDLKDPPVVARIGDNPNIAEAKRAKLKGLTNLENIIFGVVVGGAAERQGFFDAQGNPLPQAVYPIGFLDDSLSAIGLQASRNLHYLMYGSSPEVRFFLMENPDTGHIIEEALSANSHYGLGRANYTQLVQPLVPVVAKDGKWILKDSLKLAVKPGGHGDINPLLAKRGFKLVDATRLVLIQINNLFASKPLLEFVGQTHLKGSDVALMGVPRRVAAPEGILGLTTISNGTEKRSFAGNVEYTEIARSGLADEPVTAGSNISRYIGNVNALVIDPNSVFPAIEDNPFPEQVFNPKKAGPSVAHGAPVPQSRLESMMQGVARLVTPSKVLIANGPRDNDPQSQFCPFKNGDFDKADTPPQVRQAWIEQTRARLKEAGNKVLWGDFQLSPIFGEPSDLLSSKVVNTEFSVGATVVLTGSNGHIANSEIDGDFEIYVENEIGDMSSTNGGTNAVVPDQNRTGKWKVNGLTLTNKGRERIYETKDGHRVWRGKYTDNERVTVKILGNGELEVLPGTIINGALELTVNNGEKVTISSDGQGGYKIDRTNISKPSWVWKGEIDSSETDPTLFKLQMVSTEEQPSV